MRRFSFLDYVKANIMMTVPLFFSLFLFIVGAFSNIIPSMVIGGVVSIVILLASIIDYKRKKKIIER